MPIYTTRARSVHCDADATTMLSTCATTDDFIPRDATEEP